MTKDEIVFCINCIKSVYPGIWSDTPEKVKSLINDVYDVKIDRINNPGRPIASGKVKIYEAILLYALLIGSAEYLSIRFLPTMQQSIINFIIFRFQKIIVFTN